MKIALIGNMNNNNFAIMRYFRDLGVDAHLLLYSNDGIGTLSHFTPGADTWDLNRWISFIHHTDIPNAIVAAFDFPVSTVIGVRLRIQKLRGLDNSVVKPVSRAYLRRVYCGYDRYISSGITPAVFARIGKKLDLFYPYSLGVEFFKSYEFSASFRGPWYRRCIHKYVRHKQASGLLLARAVVATEPEVTGKALKDLGVQSISLALPIVYNREIPPEIPPNPFLSEIFHLVASSELSILSSSRVIWRPNLSYSSEENHLSTKNTDWLIRAFQALTAERPSLRTRMFIVEYGPDVEATKQLISCLGIQDSVTWLPKMARRELMWLLQHVSVAVGEFMTPKNQIWGGTGWEALAVGKPLIQAFLFEGGVFEKIYGYSPPPMLPVQSERDVLRHLLFCADYPSRAAEIGILARQWFDTHNGIALSKRLLDVVMDAT